jgi:hypothetical protein
MYTKQEAWDLVGGLSKPSKMPWWSWSISAKRCITGQKVRKNKNTICSKCYALKGNYSFANVVEAHERRYKALQSVEFVVAFVNLLTIIYKRQRRTYLHDTLGKIKENRFRWHDAGDLQSVEHLEKIVAIAVELPYIEFYLPTKEAGILSAYKGTFPKNLHVKFSNALINPQKVITVGNLPVTTATKGPEGSGYVCPAIKSEDGKCKDCQACWTEVSIEYPLH